MTRGTVRLVPTTGPMLLADTFPVVLDRTAVLREERIWKARVFASTAGVAERGAKIVATKLVSLHSDYDGLRSSIRLAPGGVWDQRGPRCCAGFLAAA
jgi:N-acyl-L-homoserine lactone synthetase